MKLQSGGDVLKRAAFAALMTMAAGAHAIPISGQGTWETTLQARDLNSDGVVDAYYDTALDISWLADANYTGTVLGWRFNGQTERTGALRFAADLDVYGVTGWRLPEMGQYADAAACARFSRGDFACSFQAPVADSEFAHLYYVTLGNTYGTDGGPKNTGDFRNVQSGYSTANNYTGPLKHPTWSSMQSFSFTAGSKSLHIEDALRGAWAVHDGDVGLAAPIPEPETYAMMLMGLAGLGAYARKRRVRKVIE